MYLILCNSDYFRDGVLKKSTTVIVDLYINDLKTEIMTKYGLHHDHVVPIMDFHFYNRLPNSEF